jgi:hypothetical protein
MWLSVYPYMTKEDFMTFAEFKEKSMKTTKPKKQTDEEMLAMAKLLNAAFGGKVVEK